MKKRILCIDDSNTALLLLEYALDEAGFQAILALSVDQAISEIKKQKPDLILLDLSMPDVSGYDFLNMRSQLGILDIPIIVISAFDSRESVAKTIDLGATAFIPKPIKIEAIVEKIKSFLKK
jgi:DNA-binding response OmpR family regulator